MFRRLFLLMLLAISSAVASADSSPVSILYKRESAESSQRLDTAVQSALQTLEEKLIDGGFAVIQPDPKLYAELDRATGVIINFAPDAGLSLTLDLIKSKRPESNSDRTWAEVRIKVRVFNGRRVLASLSQYDQISYRGSAEDKAFEACAQRAAATLSEKLGVKLASAPPPEPVSPIVNEPPPQSIITPPMQQPARRWAILFGVSDFSQVRKLSPGMQVDNLNGVTGDMSVMKKLAGTYGIAPENTFYLYNKDATTAALRGALESIAQKSGPEDQVFIYLSSHGMPKEEGVTGMGYPVTYDTRINVKQTMIDFEEIQQRLRSMPARRVLWVADTCHSGGAAEGMKIVEFSSRNIGVSETDDSTRIVHRDPDKTAQSARNVGAASQGQPRAVQPDVQKKFFKEPEVKVGTSQVFTRGAELPQDDIDREDFSWSEDERILSLAELTEQRTKTLKKKKNRGLRLVGFVVLSVIAIGSAVALKIFLLSV